MYGPSNYQVVDGVFRKYFPKEEKDRLEKEVAKLFALGKLGSNIFKVPQVLDIGEFHYDLEYIKDARQLNDFVGILDDDFIVDKILEILNSFGEITYHSSLMNVFKDKFLQSNIKEGENLDFGRELPIGFSHGDLTFDNILVSGETWYLIDPAWSSVESPLWDIGKILQTTAINWPGIKRYGKLSRNSNLENINRLFLERIVQKFQVIDIILGLSCQLARVSRWCFRDILEPISLDLLNKYFKKDNDECFNALLRPF